MPIFDWDTHRCRFWPAPVALPVRRRSLPLESPGLAGPVGTGLRPLEGNRRGRWAIAVNGPWRICFRFKDGDAYEVEIVDYH